MNDNIGRFYRLIFSAKLEPSFTAELIADKIGRWDRRIFISGFYRSCVIQKLADFLLSDKIGRQIRPILSFVCHQLKSPAVWLLRNRDQLHA